jgi:predicted membrane-bound spermidine synthase
MTHAEFVEAYRAGKLNVQVDKVAAARMVSARLMLPLVLLPILGLGVALALVGYLYAGGATFVAALALRHAVRRSASGFVLQRALKDEAFYAQARAAGLISE